MDAGPRCHPGRPGLSAALSRRAEARVRRLPHAECLRTARPRTGASTRGDGVDLWRRAGTGQQCRLRPERVGCAPGCDCGGAQLSAGRIRFLRASRPAWRRRRRLCIARPAGGLALGATQYRRVRRRCAQRHRVRRIGRCVEHLLSARFARRGGLFQRAILQSGSCLASDSSVPQREAESGGVRMAQSLAARTRPMRPHACAHCRPTRWPMQHHNAAD